MSEVAVSYGLHEQFINGHHLELAEHDFIKIRDHQIAVTALREIHSLYSIAAHSFIDLEKTLIETGINYWVGNYDLNEISLFFSDFFDLCSLKVLTVLNAYSAYLDQVVQRLQQMDSLAPNIARDFRERCSKEYDANADYRLFSCLRNFAQHNRLPVHGSNFGDARFWEDEADPQNSRFRDVVTVDPYLSVDELMKTKLKSKDKALLRSLDKQRIDIKATVRSFAASFSEVQHWLNGATESTFQRSGSLFEECYDDLSRSKGSEAKFVALYRDDGNGRESWGLNKETIGRISHSRSLWGGLSKAYHGSVSGKLVGGKSTFSGDRSRVWVSR